MNTVSKRSKELRKLLISEERDHECISSRWQMFFNIGVLKNFPIFTGKHPCWSLFLIKLQAFRPAKRDSQHMYFPVSIVKFLRINFIEHPRWLLLWLLQTQHWITCSKLAISTQLYLFQVKSENTRITLFDPILLFLWLSLNAFSILIYFFVVKSKYVVACFGI